MVSHFTQTALVLYSRENQSESYMDYQLTFWRCTSLAISENITIKHSLTSPYRCTLQCMSVFGRTSAQHNYAPKLKSHILNMSLRLFVTIRVKILYNLTQ
jgi:hypothetical protein